jgi:hypothetical protein
MALKDLKQCVDCAKGAITAIDLPFFNGMKGILNNTLIMQLSYHITHTLSDIDKALNTLTCVIPLKLDQATTLNTWGLIFLEKHKGTRSHKGISKAIQSFQEALDAVSKQKV